MTIFISPSRGHLYVVHLDFNVCLSIIRVRIRVRNIPSRGYAYENACKETFMPLSEGKMNYKMRARWFPSDEVKLIVVQECVMNVK